MTPTTDRPSTIVLIHGLWMTSLSWEHWVDRYTAEGFDVIAKSWPGMDVGIDQGIADEMAAGIGRIVALPRPEYVCRMAHCCSLNVRGWMRFRDCC